MAYDLGSAQFSIGVDLAQLVTGIASAKTLVGGLGTAILGAAGIVGGLGVASVKMAGDFQSGLTSLVTGAGESEKNLGLVRDGILNLATATGTSTQQLISGMYMIESAGFHGAAGLDVLKAAAEGAKVGNADLGVVANGVTTIMVDYAKEHVTAAQAVNMLVETTASGKTHMQDLSTALAMILPTAAAVGVGIEDVNGALATMTAEGVPAADAATYLRQLLMALEAPASAGAKALKSIGLSTADVSNEMKVSLPDTLQMIEEHLKAKFPEGSAAYIEALKAISGGSKQMQGMLDLTGQHLGTFQQNVENISGAVQKGGGTITGWTTVLGDFNTKVDQAREFVETFGIKIGTALLPFVEKLGTDIGQYVAPVLTNFGNWFINVGLPKTELFGQWFLNTAIPVMKQWGDLILHNVVPPVENLIGNVVTLGTQLVTWAVQSGTLQTILQDTSATLGAVVQGVSDFVGWLSQGGPWVTGFVSALAEVAVILGDIKIEEFGAKLFNAFSSMRDGAGFLANLAEKAMPEMAQAMGGVSEEEDANTLAMKGLADAVQTLSDNLVTLSGSLDTLSGSLQQVSEQAGTTSTELAGVGEAAATTAGEAGIGTIAPAITEAEGTVAAETGAMGAEIGGLAAAGGPIMLVALAFPLITTAVKGVHDSTKSMVDDLTSHIGVLKMQLQSLANSSDLKQLHQDAVAAGYDEWAQNQSWYNNWGNGQNQSPTGPSKTVGASYGPPSLSAHYLTSASPSSSSSSGVSSASQHIVVENHMYWDSQEITHLVMTSAMQRTRQLQGVRR